MILPLGTFRLSFPSLSLSVIHAKKQPKRLAFDNTINLSSLIVNLPRRGRSCEHRQGLIYVYLPTVGTIYVSSSSIDRSGIHIVLVGIPLILIQPLPQSVTLSRPQMRLETRYVRTTSDKLFRLSVGTMCLKKRGLEKTIFFFSML
jgi:hypothetical protein